MSEYDLMHDPTHDFWDESQWERCLMKRHQISQRRHEVWDHCKCGANITRLNMGYNRHHMLFPEMVETYSGTAALIHKMIDRDTRIQTIIEPFLDNHLRLKGALTQGRDYGNKLGIALNESKGWGLKQDMEESMICLFTLADSSRTHRNRMAHSELRVSDDSLSDMHRPSVPFFIAGDKDYLAAGNLGAWYREQTLLLDVVDTDRPVAQISLKLNLFPHGEKFLRELGIWDGKPKPTRPLRRGSR